MSKTSKNYSNVGNVVTEDPAAGRWCFWLLKSSSCCSTRLRAYGKMFGLDVHHGPNAIPMRFEPRGSSVVLMNLILCDHSADCYDSQIPPLLVRWLVCLKQKTLPPPPSLHTVVGFTSGVGAVQQPVTLTEIGLCLFRKRTRPVFCFFFFSLFTMVAANIEKKCLDFDSRNLSPRLSWMTSG